MGDPTRKSEKAIQTRIKTAGQRWNPGLLQHRGTHQTRWQKDPEGSKVAKTPRVGIHRLS